MSETKSTLSETDLAHFCGSEEFYRCTMDRQIVCTEGVKYVADQAGAYWLLDEIAIANRFDPKVKAEEFQVWTLQGNNRDSSAELTCNDGGKGEGGYRVTVYHKKIEYTDFPLSHFSSYQFTLWLEKSEELGRVLMLPSER